MAKKKKSGQDHSKRAGLLTFGGTLLVYALIFPFNSVGHFIVGGGVAALAGWVAKTMATPLVGLDKNAKAKTTLDFTIIQDEYARATVEKGVEMLDAFKAERNVLNESVFTRRIDTLRSNLDQALRNIIDEPNEARHLRKMNSYYLPTTLKTLQNYRSIKQQGASYATIAQTREDVLGMLDKLNEALTSLLDTMLQNDLENMDIEIDVFDKMLKSDGLRADDVTQALRQSAQAATKEVAAPVGAPQLQMPVSASATQLAHGTPVLQVKDAPAAPDFTEDSRHHANP